MTTTMIFFIFIFSFSSFLCLFPFLCYFTRCGILSLSHFLFYIQAIWPWQTIFNATHKCAMWLEEPPPLNPWYTYGMTFKSLMYGLHVCRRPTSLTKHMIRRLCRWETLTSFTSVRNSLIAFDKMEIQSKEEWTINSRCCKH